MVESAKSIVDDRSVRPYADPHRKKQRWLAVVIFLAVVAIGTASYFLLSPRDESYTLSGYDSAFVVEGSFQQTAQATGVISIPSQIELRSPEAGYAKTILVTEGDYIEVGAVVAEIDVPDLEDSLADLLDDYDSDLLNHEKSNLQDQISISKSERAISGIEEDLAEAFEEEEKMKRLVAVNASLSADLESATKQIEELKDQLAEATIELADEKRLIEIDQRIRDATLERMLRDIGRINDRIASARVTSPMSGEVLEIDAAITVPGTDISANQSLVIIANPDSAIAELELLEQYASSVDIGDRVELTISNTKMEGEIASIGRVAQTANTGLGATVSVRVRPVDSAIPLLAGSTAVGDFSLGEAVDALLLPRGPYLTTGNQRTVYVVAGNRARQQTVTFGQIQGNEVEVLSGLSAGDEAIISGYQNYIEHETVRIAQGE